MMKTNLAQMLDQIAGDKKTNLPFVFGNAIWRKEIPAEAGWYIIQTNAPISALRATPTPVEGRRYNIGQRVKESENLQGEDWVIKQNSDECWTVYNGNASNLKARAREHQGGDKGTGCLAIQFYPNLLDFEWYFEFFPVSRLPEGIEAHKLLLNLVEQAWRARNGWPILCKA